MTTMWIALNGTLPINNFKKNHHCKIHHQIWSLEIVYHYSIKQNIQYHQILFTKPMDGLKKCGRVIFCCTRKGWKVKLNLFLLITFFITPKYCAELSWKLSPVHQISSITFWSQTDFTKWVCYSWHLCTI